MLFSLISSFSITKVVKLQFAFLSSHNSSAYFEFFFTKKRKKEDYYHLEIVSAAVFLAANCMLYYSYFDWVHQYWMHPLDCFISTTVLWFVATYGKNGIEQSLFQGSFIIVPVLLLSKHLLHIQIINPVIITYLFTCFSSRIASKCYC